MHHIKKSCFKIVAVHYLMKKIKTSHPNLKTKIIYGDMDDRKKFKYI